MAHGQSWVLGSCFCSSRAVGAGINTEVTGGGCLGGRRKTRLVSLEFSGAAE